ncbi:MAG TPA: LysR family transcriptional regulator [Beijerinckiaceae bacterium]|nr:LysR family transcriptional regulator [Beijerinckiaceae bacterium]
MSGMLENIRVFMRAVESGSFSEAGRVLRISSAVASYRIRVLEEHLGCRLLTRTTRRMNLTEAGRIFYERCLDVVEAMERAEASVADEGGAPKGAIKLTAPLGLGRKVIAPIVGQFRDRHPQSEVRLRLSDHLLDLVQEAIDVALRMAVLDDSTFTQRKIAEVRRVICAAPAYLDRRGHPRAPDDLLQHDCLLLRFPGSRQFRWTLTAGSRSLTIPVSGPVDADDGDVLTDWAVAGQGLVLKPRFEVAAHLEAGRLVPVLPDCPPEPVTLAVLYPTRRMMPRQVRDLVDIIHDSSRAHVARELARIGEQ